MHDSVPVNLFESSDRKQDSIMPFIESGRPETNIDQKKCLLKPCKWHHVTFVNTCSFLLKCIRKGRAPRDLCKMNPLISSDQIPLCGGKHGPMSSDSCN